MRVICIDDKKRVGRHEKVWRVKYGCIYNTCWHGNLHDINGRIYGVGYSLEEDPNKNTFAWDEDRFATLSEIDETTFERNFKKELV